MEFNMEKVKNDMKNKLIDTLANSVKLTAKQGEWGLPTIGDLTKESTVDDVAKMTMQTAMRQISGDMGNVPTWFLTCVNATKTIMMEDEMQGMDCAAALYMSAKNKAAPEQMVTAMQRLLLVIAPETNSFSGIGWGAV